MVCAAVSAGMQDMAVFKKQNGSGFVAYNGDAVFAQAGKGQGFAEHFAAFQGLQDGAHAVNVNADQGSAAAFQDTHQSGVLVVFADHISGIVMTFAGAEALHHIMAAAAADSLKYIFV